MVATRVRRHGLVGGRDRRARPRHARRTDGPPVREVERVRPVAITVSPSGRCIVDFGQNLVGRIELGVQGPAGTTVTLRHAEVLQDGEVCTEPLRSAEATDRYTLRGAGTEVWQPRFTFHGFRYVEVDGWPGIPEPDDLTAVVLHSDMERTGWFECSDERVNRLHDNIVWGMRGNFLDLPTDCPQRDERLGWTGDINVFAPTARGLYDCAGFLASWLHELSAEQTPDGVVPWVIPNVLEWILPTAVWGDAAVVVPATVFERFGDRGVLQAQYPSMRAWIEHVSELAGDDRLWKGSFQFADWCDPTARNADPLDQRTDPDLLATAAFCHSLDLVADAAARLGETDDETRYRALAAEVRAAFAREYVTPSGRLASDAQTAYSLAIAYGLLPSDEQRTRAGRRLRKLVRNAKYTIATGFVGTPLDLRRPHRDGTRRCRVRAASPGSVPVMAVSRASRGHDDLGALGRDHGRWTSQRGRDRDALVQPLRVRCGRRLAPPCGGRTRARRTGLPAAARRTAPRWWSDVGVDASPDAVRARRVVVATRGRAPHPGCAGAAQLRRDRRGPRRRARRGRIGHPRVAHRVRIAGDGAAPCPTGVRCSRPDPGTVGALAQSSSTASA